jgi:hypothetical protein
VIQFTSTSQASIFFIVKYLHPTNDQFIYHPSPPGHSSTETTPISAPPSRPSFRCPKRLIRCRRHIISVSSTLLPLASDSQIPPPRFCLRRRDACCTTLLPPCFAITLLQNSSILFRHRSNNTPAPSTSVLPRLVHLSVYLPITHQVSQLTPASRVSPPSRCCSQKAMCCVRRA